MIALLKSLFSFAVIITPAVKSSGVVVADVVAGVVGVVAGGVAGVVEGEVAGVVVGEVAGSDDIGVVAEVGGAVGAVVVGVFAVELIVLVGVGGLGGLGGSNENEWNTTAAPIATNIAAANDEICHTRLRDFMRLPRPMFAPSMKSFLKPPTALLILSACKFLLLIS